MSALAGELNVMPTSQNLTRARHSAGESILLHLWPGAVMVAAYVAAVPFAAAHGLPPLLVICVLATTVLAPLELAHLLLVGRRDTGTWSLRTAVLSRPPMAFWRYAAIVPIVLVASIVLYAVSQPADKWFTQHGLTFLPAWFDYGSLAPYRHLTRNVLLLTIAARFVADIVVVPVSEELYFRGYLLPRIPAPGWLRPFANAVLFALYHFWQPFNWPSIACLSLPMILAAAWTKDVRISIASHVALNLIGWASFAIAVLQR